MSIYPLQNTAIKNLLNYDPGNTKEKQVKSYKIQSIRRSSLKAGLQTQPRY